MFDELNKYKQKDHFFFRRQDELSTICNAPDNKSGIYIVYALQRGKIELVYIGSSGELQEDGSMVIRKAGLSSIKDQIVNGHQFGEIPGRTLWPSQMELENIEVLDVYWYITHNDEYIDCPGTLENKLLKKYLAIYGKLPKWNKEL